MSVSLIAYLNRVRQTHPNILYDDKYTHLAANVNYVHDKKYIIDFSSAWVYSVKLPEENRTGLSPSLALGWILSEEDFLKESSHIDFLKLRLSAGMLNTDMAVSEVYLHQDLFANSGSYSWNDGVRSNDRTVFQNVGNNDLFFERKIDYNLGIEAGLLEEALWLDLNFFKKYYADQILQQTANYNDYLGGFVPYSNFGEDQYTGVEVRAMWRQSFGDFRLDAGINGSYLRTEILKTNEIFEHDYQYRTGKHVNAIFGLESLGLFRDANEINAHATQMFGEVSPGDIKYADQNGDGIIDQNDEVMIGDGIPKFSGGIHIKLGYKNFTLFGIATGMQGSERFYNNEYYWVYGDRKYSEVVLERWTPQTASTATYPRLTSETSGNNFRPSTYWLYDNSSINLNRVQLSYDFPQSIDALSIGHLSLYIRGSNLATLSKNREKMELNTGTTPQFRSYSMGLKALFF